MLRKVIALLLALLVAVNMQGCAGSAKMLPSAPSDADLIDSKLPLRCPSKEQCDRWWRTAQVWVVKNAGFKIQVATDAILQTYNPTAGASSWAFQVTRAPDGATSEVFEIEARCGMYAACSPVYETVIADFKRAVLATR